MTITSSSGHMLSFYQYDDRDYPWVAKCECGLWTQSVQTRAAGRHLHRVHTNFVGKRWPSKAAYVKRQPQTRSHTCHWPGCRTQVPPAMWGCAHHWSRIPERLRTRLWRFYEPGQEESMDPSPDYVRTAQEIQDWISTSTGR